MDASLSSGGAGGESEAIENFCAESKDPVEGVLGATDVEASEQHDVLQGTKTLVDRVTDTASSHKLIALHNALINSAMENAKREFSNTFTKQELSFFDKVFRIANIAQDGLLNESELMFFLENHDYVMSKQEARQFIRDGDANKDGALDFTEFLELCKKAKVNLQELGIFAQDGEEQLQNSVKVRNLFRHIVDVMGHAPSIKATLSFFENKISAVTGSVKNMAKSKPKRPKRAPVSPISKEVGSQYSDDEQEVTSTSESQNSLSCLDSQTSLDFDYDLIVLGNGAGGAGPVDEAVKAGKRVAICDSASTTGVRAYGSSCMSVGCVPKMLMNHAAYVGNLLDPRSCSPLGLVPKYETNKNEGTSTGNAFRHDWSTLISNIQKHIRTLNDERQHNLQYDKGVQCYMGKYEFESPHKILVANDEISESISGEKIVIATGSCNRDLEVPGASGNCTHVEDIFSLRHPPGRVLIVGGGPDAIESAGILCSLNVEVTIMSKSPTLKGFDRRMVTLLLESLHLRGVKMLIGWAPVEILRAGEGELLTQKTVISRHLQTGEKSKKEYDTIILAIGKEPSTPLLSLDKAEVLTDEESGKIWVDSQDMTTAEDVYAIGDCTSHRPNDTAVSFQAGMSLSRRLYQGHTDSMEYDQVMPKFLLTPVQYACVGLSQEAAAVEHGGTNCEIYLARFQPLQYQLGTRYKDAYYAKMITLKSENERVIGLHYLGPNAGEIMQGFGIALKLKATKADFDAMIPLHPTCAELFSRMTKCTDTSDPYLNTSC